MESGGSLPAGDTRGGSLCSESGPSLPPPTLARLSEPGPAAGGRSPSHLAQYVGCG